MTVPAIRTTTVATGRPVADVDGVELAGAGWVMTKPAVPPESGVAVGDGVAAVVGCAVAEAVGCAVAVAVGSGVAVAVGSGVAVAVGSGVAVAVGSGVAVAVGSGVAVGVGSALGASLLSLALPQSGSARSISASLSLSNPSAHCLVVGAAVAGDSAKPRTKIARRMERRDC
jgi:hypothetical protein